MTVIVLALEVWSWLGAPAIDFSDSPPGAAPGPAAWSALSVCSSACVGCLGNSWQAAALELRRPGAPLASACLLSLGNRPALRLDDREGFSQRDWTQLRSCGWSRCQIPAARPGRN